MIPSRWPTDLRSAALQAAAELYSESLELRIRHPRFEDGNLILHDTAPDFFHRDAFGLDGRVAVRVVMFAQAGPCATAKLLGTHCSHVHEQETVRDGWRRHLWESGRVDVGLLVGVLEIFSHKRPIVPRWALRDKKESRDGRSTRPARLLTARARGPEALSRSSSPAPG